MAPPVLHAGTGTGTRAVGKEVTIASSVDHNLLETTACVSSRGLSYKGSAWLRQRLVLSALSKRPVRIWGIREGAESPGILEYEASLLRLLEKVTNGTRIEINSTGTHLSVCPGSLDGGVVEHTCPTGRSLGYWLEFLLCLAPFCRRPLRATLRGVTNGTDSPSADLIKATVRPALAAFGLDEGFDIQVLARGVLPKGGGEVTFTCPVRRSLRPVKLAEPGKVAKVRGTAFGVRVSPQMSNRVILAARGVLCSFLPDVYVTSDHRKGKAAGGSPGFGMALVAVTTEGYVLGAELTSDPVNPGTPEDLGKRCAHHLLDEISRGGCVDSATQGLTILLVAMGLRDVSKVLTGPLTDHSVALLRHLRDFFSLTFHLEEQKATEDDMRCGDDKVILTCVGVGFTNLSKPIR
uniref:RNA 3'-terminal phosphate cyclase-like protein n=1 Tax=Myxine glutinosa TaxID=7769 RepID=UPI00358E63D0